MQINNSFVKKLNRAFKHGLIIDAIATRLKKLGIVIQPVYLMQEFLTDNLDEKFDVDFNSYEVFSLTDQDMESISQKRDWSDIESLRERLKQDKKCFGVKLNGELAGFTWANLHECDFTGDPFLLKEDEAYLFDAYTFPEFRGRGLAPFIRHQCYKSLNKIGITKFYSYSIGYNTPAIAFKQKLGAKFLRLYIWIRLFKKYNWCYMVKRYN